MFEMQTYVLCELFNREKHSFKSLMQSSLEMVGGMKKFQSNEVTRNQLIELSSDLLTLYFVFLILDFLFQSFVVCFFVCV